MSFTIHQSVANGFTNDWYVRSAWIAFTTLWVFWGLVWFLRHAFGGDEPSHNAVAGNYNNAGYNNNAAGAGAYNNNAAVDGTGASVPATDAEVGNKKKFATPTWTSSLFYRVERAQNMLRDLVLMLLSVLVINNLAGGSTRAVMILAWIFFAFAVIWFFVETVIENRFTRLIYALIFYAIGLAIIGLAFAQGFH